MKSSISIFGVIVVAIALFQGRLLADLVPEKAVRLPVMTWYHPVLEPGVSDILLLCTVVSVTEGNSEYQNPYWKVRLRIDERLHVADRYAKRLENVIFIESGDFRKRSVNDRLVLFAGGEAYEGDDFLTPCWSGTSTDLGILLHPPGHSDENQNDVLLTQLRAAAKGNGNDVDFMEAFAEFSPKGVAHHLIMRMRIKQMRKEAGEKTELKKKE